MSSEKDNLNKIYQRLGVRSIRDSQFYNQNGVKENLRNMRIRIKIKLI